MHCPNCSGDLADSDYPERCPYCNERLGKSADSERRLTPLFRFGNAAEAGFFAHELQGRIGIPARIIAVDNFDALSGTWGTRFVLAVALEQAEPSRRTLHDLMSGQNSDAQSLSDYLGTNNPEDQGAESIGSNRETTAFDHPAFDDEPTAAGHLVMLESAQYSEASGINWVPIVLTLAAGSVAFWWMRNPVQEPQDNDMGARHERLLPFLTEEGEPWVQSVNDGKGQRRLTPAATPGKMLLQEDWDGDGEFEKSYSFQNGVLTGVGN